MVAPRFCATSRPLVVAFLVVRRLDPAVAAGSFVPYPFS
jgi:hypothetical protein